MHVVDPTCQSSAESSTRLAALPAQPQPDVSGSSADLVDRTRFRRQRHLSFSNGRSPGIENSPSSVPSFQTGAGPTRGGPQQIKRHTATVWLAAGARKQQRSLRGQGPPWGIGGMPGIPQAPMPGGLLSVCRCHQSICSARLVFKALAAPTVDEGPMA